MQDIQRIEKIFKMLSSTHDGEIINAVNAIRKILLAQDKTFNDLAAYLFHGLNTSTHGMFTEDFYDRMRRAYCSQPSAARPQPKKPDALMKKCEYLVKMPTVMTQWESTFIDDIYNKMLAGQYYLSQKQLRWIDSIYQKYTTG